MDPREIPDDEDVQAALNAARQVAAPQATADQRSVGLLGQALPGEPYRVAVWGDSHLAAGFFTFSRIPATILAFTQLLKKPSTTWWQSGRAGLPFMEHSLPELSEPGSVQESQRCVL
jgi:hypothetical protein